MSGESSLNGSHTFGNFSDSNGNNTFGNLSDNLNATKTPEITREDFDYVRNIRFHLLVVILPIGLFFNCFFIGVYGYVPHFTFMYS